MPELKSLHERFFNIVIFLNYLLYFLIIIGLSSTAPKYLSTFHFYMQIYISLFLLYRFNPFRKIKFKELDRKVAFSAGVFMMTTSAIGKIMGNYLKNISVKALPDNIKLTQL